MIYDELTPEFELLCWVNGIDLSKMDVNREKSKFLAAVPVIKFETIYPIEPFMINNQQYALIFEGYTTLVFVSRREWAATWLQGWPCDDFIAALKNGQELPLSEQFFKGTLGNIK